MNSSLGTAGVALALVSSLGGVLTVIVAQAKRRPTILKQIPAFVGLVMLGAAIAVGAMQRALITRDFSVEFVRKTHLYTDRASFDRYLDALREAGVPEGSERDGDRAGPESHQTGTPTR